METTASQLRIRLYFALGLLVAGALQFVLLLINHFPIGIAVKDAFFSVLIMLLLTQILYLIQHNYHAAKPLNFVSVAIVFVFAGIYQLAFNGAFRLLSETQWQEYIFPYEPVRGTVSFLVLLISSLYWWTTKNEATQLKIQQQLIEKERALTAAELDNIHRQLQPHFLFNSLNSIGALTILEPKEAHRMIQMLSAFLRGTLRKDIHQLVSLEEELKQLRLYLDIEKVRFGHRLTTEITQDENCEEAKLPALIIQPVIENAIKYGLYGQLNSILISVSITCDQKLLRVSISSPYDETYVAASAGSGFGLSSIRKRLSLFFGQTDLLTTTKTPDLFTTTILIPQL